MTRKKRIILVAGAAALLIAVIAVSSAFFLIKKTVNYSGTLRAEVKAPLTVTRGSNGIPHIQSMEIEDALFSLGYLHAQDRLVLIEYYRAVAAGRLSSLLGEQGILIDKLSRTMDFRGEAKKLALAVDGKYSALLASYVKGINLFRRQEMRGLLDIARLPAEDWAPCDVISILLLLEWSNAFLNNREQVFLVPDQLLTMDVRKALPPALTFGYPETDRNNVLLLKELRGLVKSQVGTFNSGYAFYISPSEMSDEQPVVAFSLESLNKVYPLWYPVRMTVKNETVTGITASGLPFVFSGRNGSIAFSSVNLSLDVQDFYRERTRKGMKGTEFFNRGRWTEFKSRDEVIESVTASGAMDTINHRVRLKDDCPVLSDVFKGRFSMDVVSIKHSFPQKGYIHALFDIPFSTTITAAEKTLNNLSMWPKCYLLVSREEAGLVLAGTVPVRAIGGDVFRKGEQYTGHYPQMNVSAYSRRMAGGYAIIGSDMLEALPAALNAFKVYNDIKRAKRLDDLVTARMSEPQSIPDILHDRESSIARQFTPAFYELLDKMPIPTAKLCRIYFKNWDYTANRLSVPAAITHMLVYNMFRETFDDELKDETYGVMENMYWALDGFYGIMEKDDHPLFDDISTGNLVESKNMIFDRAFLKTLKYLNTSFGPYMKEWTWGHIHKVIFSLPLGKRESFLHKEMKRSKLYRVGGDGSTLMRGSINVNDRFRVGELTAVSVCYQGQSSSISQAVGVSTNPISEYYQYNMDNRQFTDFEQADIKYEMKFIPIR